MAVESHKSFLKGFEPKHSPSHAYTLEGLAPTATALDAILALLKDEGFPLWTLNPPPHRMTPVIETLICFATMVSAEGATGEAPYCEAKNDERKWCQKEDRSHGLVSTANTARQGRRKKNNAAKLSRLF